MTYRITIEVNSDLVEREDVVAFARRIEERYPSLMPEVVVSEMIYES